MVDSVSFGLKKSGGLMKSSSKGNLAEMMASAGAGEKAAAAPVAPAQAVPVARSPVKEGALLKRSRSMGTFGPYLNFGQQAVEEISGKTSIGPPSGESGSTSSNSGASSDNGGGSAAQVPVRPSTVPIQSNADLQPTASSQPAQPAQQPAQQQASAVPAAPAEAEKVAPASPRQSSSSPQDTPELRDDNDLHHVPMARVDYFSHEWNESDLAGSWRYIVSRRQDMANSARLENASWRTWAKAKNNLKTIRPEEVNWLKDYDVTWLYGPLYHERSSTDWDKDIETLKTVQKKSGKKADSIKSILKKKTIAEIMLEDAPEYKSPADNYLRHHNYRQIHTDSTNIAKVVNSQYKAHPQEPEDRHVHFNDRVEQCIALDPEEQDAAQNAVPVQAPAQAVQGFLSDSDSEEEEDGLFLGIQRSVGSNTSLASSRTIAPLPATTLNLPDDEEAEETHGLEITSSSRNYDYNSVYTSAEPAYKIVDPQVQAVAVPSAVAQTLERGSKSPPRQPMVSFGCSK